MFYVGGAIFISSGPGNDNVDRLRCPWWLGGCPWWGWCYFYMAVSRARGAPPLFSEGVFSLFAIHLASARLALCLK